MYLVHGFFSHAWSISRMIHQLGGSLRVVISSLYVHLPTLQKKCKPPRFFFSSIPSFSPSRYDFRPLPAGYIYASLHFAVCINSTTTTRNDELITELLYKYSPCIDPWQQQT
jgi:hypothetical protein